MAQKSAKMAVPKLGDLLKEHHEMVLLGQELIRIAVCARVANHLEEALAAEQAAEDCIACCTPRMKKQPTREPTPAGKPPEAVDPRGNGHPSAPHTPYRDRPTDDGMYGDGSADPSGVGNKGEAEHERKRT